MKEEILIIQLVHVMYFCSLRLSMNFAVDSVDSDKRRTVKCLDVNQAMIRNIAKKSGVHANNLGTIYPSGPSEIVLNSVSAATCSTLFLSHR